MRPFQVALLLLLAVPALDAAAWADAPGMRVAPPEVRAVRHGEEVVISHRDTLTANVVAMLESCTVNSTANAVAEGTWAQQLTGDSFVLIRFSRPREVYVKAADNESRGTRAVSEILLPLPEGKWPQHLYARTGTEVLSFARYSAVPLKDIVMDGELRLGAVPPYDFLMKTPQ
jgi:antitoxin (DNA-binding transcriptional repressor) of toxin-antitoxin stability system